MFFGISSASAFKPIQSLLQIGETSQKCTDEGISLINTVADWQNDSIGACTKEWKPIDMVLCAVILDLERSRQAHWWKH